MINLIIVRICFLTDIIFHIVHVQSFAKVYTEVPTQSK